MRKQRHYMDEKETNRNKILIIRNSALGDVAMTIPIIYSFAKEYHQKEIYVLTRPFFGRLFINAPDNVKIIPVDFKKEFKGTTGMIKLLRELDKYEFTEIADFHDVMRSWEIDVFFALKGKKVRKLSKDRKGRRKLLKDKTPQLSYIDRYLGVLNRLGYHFPLTFKSVFGIDKPETPIHIEHPAIGIAPFARYKTKEYPLELLEMVITRLEEAGINVYLFGGKEDASILDGIVRNHINCTNVAGKYTIESELKIMSHLDLMLTMDSANQHLASLVGVRNISIWGSTVAYGGFLAYGQSMDDAISAGIPCQPCSVAGKQNCPLHKNTECMRMIESRQVAEKIINILK